MDAVFSTDAYAPARRYTAWREAICDVYVNVDVQATRPEDYRGFIREARFGEVVLTDILLSEQRIRRGRGHLSRFDKDCYYVQLLQRGTLNVSQRGANHRSNMARGAIFLASEEYELHCQSEVRAFYLEIPRSALAQRFAQARVPVSAELNTTIGLGRVLTEFCASLAAESARLQASQRAPIGDQLMNLLALSLQSAPDDPNCGESSVKALKLKAVQHWIDQNLSDPNLTLDRIAAANGISLRYLHQLFDGQEMSASEWVWSRRLSHAYDCLARGDGRSITAIAFDHGFNSSAHFSTLFRRRFGFSPRDLARTRAQQG